MKIVAGYLGRERYYIDGELVMDRWSYSPTAVREFTVDKYWVAIVCTADPTSFSSQAYVDGKLHVEELFPSVTASIAKFFGKMNDSPRTPPATITEELVREGGAHGNAPTISAEEYPFVTKLVKARWFGSLTVYAVLFEDGYETTFGDGAFNYLQIVFLRREDAKRHISRNRDNLTGAYRTWCVHHLRKLSISLRGAELILEAHQGDPHDSYDVASVMKMLENRYGHGFWIAHNGLSWGVAWDAEWLLVVPGSLSVCFCYDASAVDRLLAADACDVTIHPVPGIHGDAAGPGLSRAEWMAGKRVPNAAA